MRNSNSNSNSNADAAPVMVFDFDGVIIKSHVAKRRAMLAMFTEYPEKSAEIDACILSHGGVARREKLAAILQTVIGTAATPALLAHYLSRYTVSLKASLVDATFVDGVQDFVSRCFCPVYISSTAPEAEIHEQLQRGGLLHYFVAVYGSRVPKAKALGEVSAQHPGRDIVFFGDSHGDLVAARDAKVAFVAVTNERDNFKNVDVVKLESFDSRAKVECSTRTALSRFAMGLRAASLPIRVL